MKKKQVLYEAKQYKDIRELITDTVTSYSENVAFIVKEKKEEVQYHKITYKMLQEDINRLGSAMMELGLHGKRVAIIANNCYEWCLAYLTTLCGLGIVVPLDKSLPAGEIESLLQRSYANAVIFGEQYEDIMKDIQKNGNNDIEYFIAIKESKNEKFLSLSTLLQRGKELLEQGDTKFQNTQIDSEGMNIILFTSGTTSASKAVMLSQKNLVANIHDLNTIVKIKSTDRNLAFLPLHHTFGSTALLFFMSNGITSAFCDGLKYIQKNLEEYRITIFVCVPLLLEAMNKKILKEIDKQGKTKLIRIATRISNILLKVRN